MAELYDCTKGGQNCTNSGQSRAIRAVFAAFGSVSHRLLVFSSWHPRTRLLLPLGSTFSHILAVSRLLSSRNLKVFTPLVQSPGKTRTLVVNQSSDH